MPIFKNYHPVPASLWVTLTQDKQNLLRNAGGFVVNDVFMPLWEREATLKREIILPYGTYGSGKTQDRVQELILSALTLPYMRGYYGKEIFDSAKKELHTTFIQVIEEMRVQDLFKFSTEPNGTKDISCRLNGNSFHAFGCDNPKSFKGWANPTHILVDELDQISFESFGMLQSRLRKKNAPKCFVGPFNNCDVPEDHWLRTQVLNPDIILKDSKGDIIERNIIENFSLYTDNHFIDHEDYRIALITQAGDDLIRQEAVLKGHWGAKTTKNPFYKNFAPSRHVRLVEYDPNLALHMSWDENVNPYFPVGIFQLYGKEIRMIDEIANKNPRNSIRCVCDDIIAKYGPEGLDHKAGFFVYGDATSKKRNVAIEEDKNFYPLIAEYLQHFHPKMRVGVSNPNVAMRGNFINAILGLNYDGLVLVISTVCKHAIADLVNTIESPDGNGKDKTKTQVDGVKGVQRWGHFSDLLDYLICFAYSDSYYKFQNGGKVRSWASARRRPKNVI